MIVLLASLAIAQDKAPAPEGWRIAGFGGQSGLRLAQEAVVGRTGGTDATTAQVRWVRKELTISASLPWAAWATPEDRRSDIGNLHLAGYYQLADLGSIQQAVGAEIYLPGSGAYTWVNHSEDLWPGGGLDAVWLGRMPMGRSTLLLRGALGFHGARGFEPFPNTYPRFQAGVAVDKDLFGPVGWTHEAVLSYWDTSPLETSHLLRINVTDHFQARGGLVFPWATWFGWTPTGQRGGLRETTLLLDVSMRL